ncbi:type IV secretion system protein [Microvirga tunisiensis]|uniref:Type IV secretion system protein n=1 Tax=Microvirga tunisiensis TaxID=2108360 RepID=A0A5N7MMY6_9HYPH|nr:type IV secretion system protein [Microvirga tunisiensis]MPR10161.1 type IV secretion system protein [Microvirga tunisiensis]MPR28367.1 type IV secretion system protein [Microvirga tunisiensis]
MGVISSLASEVDATLIDFVKTVFTEVAVPIRTLLQTVALIALLFIAVNHVIQFTNVNYSIYLQWGLRYILIYSFATMWENFEGIYAILMTVPADYAALLIRAASRVKIHDGGGLVDPTRISDLHSAMDEFARALTRLAKSYYTRKFSIWHIGDALKNVCTGIFIQLVCGLFVATSAIIVLVGKIGIAASISLAPLAIIMLMMPQTKQYFESWTRLTVGFLVTPLLTTALMSIVLFIAAEIYAKNLQGPDLDRGLAFVFIMIAAVVLLAMIPTMASTLASASVAAVGAGVSSAAVSMIKGGVWGGGKRLLDGVGSGIAARSNGASPAAAGRSAIAAMLQSSNVRQQRWNDVLGRRITTPRSLRRDRR